MRKLLLSVLAVLAGTLVVYGQTLRDMDIRAELLPDGSARITQVWDATVVDGTEMYIPISNLGKMTVQNLCNYNSVYADAFITAVGMDFCVERNRRAPPAAYRSDRRCASFALPRQQRANGKISL